MHYLITVFAWRYIANGRQKNIGIYRTLYTIRHVQSSERESGLSAAYRSRRSAPLHYGSNLITGRVKIVARIESFT